MEYTVSYLEQFRTNRQTSPAVLRPGTEPPAVECQSGGVGHLRYEAAGIGLICHPSVLGMYAIVPTMLGLVPDHIDSPARRVPGLPATEGYRFSLECDLADWWCLSLPFVLWRSRPRTAPTGTE